METPKTTQPLMKETLEKAEVAINENANLINSIYSLCNNIHRVEVPTDNHLSEPCKEPETFLEKINFVINRIETRNKELRILLDNLEKIIGY